MSLAISAAPFNNDDSSSYVNPPKSIQSRKNKTVKIRAPQKISSTNVGSIVTDKTTTANLVNSELSGEMGDFVPLEPPTSAGVEATKSRDTSTAEDSLEVLGPQYAGAMDTGEQDMMLDTRASNKDSYDKYRQYMPDYAKMYGPGVQMDKLAADVDTVNAYSGAGVHMLQQGNMRKMGGGDPLIDKLNYVINLLEEQKDDKTSRVNEEIILYFCLGIFVIFIVDSFTRLGKYTR
tara:strand:+ start:29168 stop:29869 length:702 start_codon:yes stop_codon:yes gene_type:complete